jgi:N-acetylglucosaminyldiphosphoundecaprenol N-acetyl-beta-D-mannosaminyltransferase
MKTPSHSALEPGLDAVAVLGVPFDPVTASGAVARIEQMIASREPHFLVTANVDFLVQARNDIELHRIFLNADMVLCDGTPIVWASRWLRTPLPERVAGADLVPLMLKVAARKGYRPFFLGASPEAAQEAVARLHAQYPTLDIAGHYSPPFSSLLEMDHEECRRRILTARPDLLFVAFGCPKQEKWMAMHCRNLGVPVTIGVGGTIDFLAGRIRRAPLWVQRTGAEWLFRLAQEPRRLLHRYLRDLWTFAWAFLAETCMLRRGSKPDESSRTLSSALDEVQVNRATRRHCDCAQNNGRGFAGDVLLDLAGVEVVDSGSLGRLLRLERSVRSSGRKLILVAVSRTVRRILAQTRLEHFFAYAPTTAAAQGLLAQDSQGGALAVQLDAESHRLAWYGEVTAATGETIWAQTRSALQTSSPREAWSIDLAKVGYIDSSGLGVMVRAKKLAQQQHQELWFSAPQPTVRNVLQLAGLENFLLRRASSRRHKPVIDAVPGGNNTRKRPSLETSGV